MKIHRHLLHVLLPVLLLAAGNTAAHPPRAVSDLAYGEVLYHFFQEDYFTAITRLEIALARNRLPHHRQEAELLHGGLLLSYGLIDAAEAIFERLLNPDTPAQLRNRVWYYLARLNQRRGRPEEAARAIARVEQKRLPLALKDQARLLQARILMDLGDYQAAIPLLSAPGRSHILDGYARFNLGVALERSGHPEEARRILSRLGEMETDDEELATLRDKANLALGYSHLREKRAVPAIEALQRVRLHGLAADPALLGMGWAEFARGRLPRALAAWDTLSRRSVTSPAVQEGLLAIPYALMEAGAYAQAARRYEQAIEALTAERDHVATLRRRVQEQGVADMLLAGDDDPGRGWLWELHRLPEDATSRELLGLMAGSEFQAVLRNYRELRFLAEDLDRWRDSTGAFRDMLNLRRRGYALRLPDIEAGLRRLDLAAVRQQRDAYFARLQQIREKDDSEALASAGEQALRARLDRVRALLDRHPGATALRAQRDKLRLLEGVWQWRLAEDFKARLWTVRKHLKELDRALAEAETRRAGLEKARRLAPRGFEGYDQRITALEGRLARLRSRVDQALAHHDAYLRTLVLQALDRRAGRLRAYEVQARYGLARIYDLAAEREHQP
ncbi:MAG TPA: tetratricopeptide repeat protein [Gammaproteobacteria bacterium]|nr:tetratricopeptide repeat protein [Gammaproteobacteria bacterium]